MKWIEKNPLTVLFLCGIGIFLIHLNILPVSIMEARNFITAREMLTDGHWLLTTMNDLPRYQKPPLPSWITAGFGFVFGENVVSYRIPAMLMAIILGVICYLFTLKLLQDKKQALLSGLILLTSFYVIIITNEAPWDIYTHTFMLIGIYFLFQFFELQKRIWKYALLAAFFTGLSFMSKGPVSMYVMLLPFLIAYGIVFKYAGFKKKIIPLTTFILTTAIISLWWYLYVRYADPNTFDLIAKKEAGNWSSYNVRPFYYYWSFFIQTGIWTIPAFISLLYPYLKNRVSHKKGYRFTFLWTLISLVLLSIIPEKKSRYLFPVLIPLAINTSFYLDYIIRAFKKHLSKKEKLPVYFHFGLIACIGIAFPFVSYFIIKQSLPLIWGYYIIASIMLFALGVTLFLFLYRQKIKHCFFILILFVIAIKICAFPLSKAFPKNASFNTISSFVNNTENEKFILYAYDRVSPEMIWYYGQSIPLLKNNLSINLSEERTFGVLVSIEQEIEFKRIFEKDFNIKLKEVFDINLNANPGKKGYKNRLVSKLYLIKK